MYSTIAGKSMEIKIPKRMISFVSWLIGIKYGCVGTYKPSIIGEAITNKPTANEIIQAAFLSRLLKYAF